MTTHSSAYLACQNRKLTSLNDIRAYADARNLAYVLFRHIAPHPLYGPNTLLQTLFFADNSFLFFCDAILQKATFEDAAIFKLDETQTAHLSIDVSEDNGAIEHNTGVTFAPWDNHHITPLEESITLFHEADDPTFDGTADTRLWSDDNIADAEAIMKKIFLGLAQNSQANIEVVLESFDYGDGLIINEAEHIDAELFVAITDIMIDKEPFNGHLLIPTEGDGDRWSHYYGDPLVNSFWFDMDTNAHHALKTRAWLSDAINTDPRFETVKDKFNAAHKD